MGITGLLPFLEKASQKTHISQFSGGTVAIDSYCWLHKGAFSCADKLSMGQQTDAYVIYCMKFVNMLLSHKIKPILVFDGRDLPAKAPTEVKRREARIANRRKAVELMQMGKHSEGRNLLRRSLNITHEMALELIKHCQELGIDCIVAPYEADAQLAYLNISGIADVVITEDSDLTLFGCKKVFFKMDVTGNGVLVDQEKIHLAMEVRSEHFEMDKFMHMCILSGCDYLPSLPGIGLAKAKKFIMNNTECDIYQALTRLASSLNMKTLTVTKEYRDSFQLAYGTFKYQLVYCPLQRKQVRLNTPPPDVTEEQLHHAGAETDPETAFQLALGNCDPFTFKTLHNYNPDTLQSPEQRKNQWGKREIVKHASIWSKDYTSESKTASSKKTKAWPSTAGRQMTMQITRCKTEIATKKIERPDIVERIQEKDMLSLYTNETVKTEEEPEDVPKQTSPILSRRNVFAKQGENLKTSPSLIKVGRSRLNSRNLMRARRTIIDDNVVTESKFFAQLSQKENTDNSNDVNRSANTSVDANRSADNSAEDLFKEEKTETRRSSRNRNSDIADSKDTDLPSLRENKKSLDNPSVQKERIVPDLSAHRVTIMSQSSQDSKSSSREPGSSVGQSQSSFTETLSNVSTEVEYNASSLHNLAELEDDSDIFVDQCSISTLHTSLFKWSNTKSNEQPKLNHDKRKPLNRSQTVRNSTLNTSTKRRTKQVSPVTKQQGLLNMYGFSKRANLKH